MAAGLWPPTTHNLAEVVCRMREALNMIVESIAAACVKPRTTFMPSSADVYTPSTRIRQKSLEREDELAVPSWQSVRSLFSGGGHPGRPTGANEVAISLLGMEYRMA